MAILYHGTSAECYEQIIQNGFSSNNDFTYTWDVSWEEYIYGYDFKKVQKVLGSDEDPIEEDLDHVESHCIESAFGNARVSAAVQDSKSDFVFVLKIEIPDNFVEDDISCGQEMEEASCVSLDNMKNFKILEIYKSKYVPSLRIFYMANTMYDILNVFPLEPEEFRALEEVHKKVDLLGIVFEVDYEYQTLGESINIAV
jgi:hypothetical protein